jgi:hypothetical protein
MQFPLPPFRSWKEEDIMVSSHWLKTTICFALIALLGAAIGEAARATEFRVSTYAQNGQLYPSVASNTAGYTVVVWHSQTQDGGTSGVYGQRFYPNGDPLGGEFKVNTYTTDAQDWPTVAICDSGRFIVVWTSYDQDGSDAGVYGQLFDLSGNKLFEEFRVNSYTTNRQKYPVVAMDDNGAFVVAWQSRYQDGSEDGIYAQRFDNHCARLGSEFRVNTITQGYQMLPAIDRNPDGNFVIAWMRDLQDGNGGKISMQRYASDGTPQDGEVSVNAYWGSALSNPAVGIDDHGDIVVAWDSQDQDGSADGIYAQMFHADGTPNGGEFQVNTYTANSQSVPAVAMHALGSFLIFWQSDGQDGSLWGVYGQMFDDNGSFVDPEFRFNTYTNDMQMMPAAAIDGDGTFIVTWMSNGQDGSGHGIYADYGAIRVPGSVTQEEPIPASVTLRCPGVILAGEPARLSLTLAIPAAVELSLYDAGGALVRRMPLGDLPAGVYEVLWDGARASGEPSPSGVYFVRARAGRAAVTGRILLLR